MSNSDNECDIKDAPAKQSFLWSNDLRESTENVELQATTSSTNTTAEVMAEEDVLYKNVDGVKCFLELKGMLEETSMHETGQWALKLMNLLPLGKIEKGAGSIKERYKSLQYAGMV